MGRPSDLESRVARLEAQVGELAERVRHSEQGAAAARVLAGGVDRDVHEMRDFRQATTAALNALRETQREQGHQLRNHGNQLRELSASVDTGMAEMRGKFDATAAGLQENSGMLTKLIAQQGTQQDNR